MQFKWFQTVFHFFKGLDTFLIYPLLKILKVLTGIYHCHAMYNKKYTDEAAITLSYIQHLFFYVEIYFVFNK